MEAVRVRPSHCCNNVADMDLFSVVFLIFTGLPLMKIVESSNVRMSSALFVRRSCGLRFSSRHVDLGARVNMSQGG